MNAIAAAPGWRNLAIWAMPPVAYALASDTLIGVVRAWAIARHRQLATAWPPSGHTAGRRRRPGPVAAAPVLAPASTLAGFRAWVLEECPVAPGRAARPPPAAAGRPGLARSGRSRGRRPRPPGSWPWPPNDTALSPPSRYRVARSPPAWRPRSACNPGAARTALRKAVLAAQNGDPR